jgi:Tfp pilus assembly protein PilW
MQTPCTTTAQGVSGNFIISYTIGEMPLVQSWKSNGLMITQGVLQPVATIADTLYECYGQTEVKVYPNPNPGTFSLQLSILKKGNVKTNLFDATGRLLQTDAFEYTTFTNKQYNISTLVSGTYFLQLLFTEAGSTRAKKCVYTIQKIN